MQESTNECVSKWNKLVSLFLYLKSINFLKNVQNTQGHLYNNITQISISFLKRVERKWRHGWKNQETQSQPQGALCYRRKITQGQERRRVNSRTSASTGPQVLVGNSILGQCSVLLPQGLLQTLPFSSHLWKSPLFFSSLLANGHASFSQRNLGELVNLQSTNLPTHSPVTITIFPTYERGEVNFCPY